MNHPTPAPTGHDVKAQGNALGKRPMDPSSPERATQFAAARVIRRGKFRPFRACICLGLFPRALPWAIACRPVGTMAARRVVAMNHPSPAPKGHDVKARGNALGMARKSFPSPERA